MSEIIETPTSGIGAEGGWQLGGRYRVLDAIGRGGMAEVFRAHDDVLDRLVAVKVFRSPSADAPAGSDRVRQGAEVRALAALNHPNLTALYDASVDSDPPFLVLELIDGPSLANQLADGPLIELSVRSIGIQVADALAYVHARGMVHRDVKPANVLLGKDATSRDAPWRVRLTDFGIVRLLGTQRVTTANLTLGSASYLAPEQACGADVGPAADIFSLGLVLIEALTGRRCFDGSAPEALAARLNRPPAVPMDAPAPWPELLTAMTALDPQTRPSATAVAKVLRDPPRGTGDAFAPTMAFLPITDNADEVAVLPARRHHLGRIAAGLLVLIIAGIVAIGHSSLPGSSNPNRVPAGNGSPASVSAPPTHHATSATSSAAPSSRPTSHPRPSTTAARTTSSAPVIPPPTHTKAPKPPPTSPTPTPTPTPTSSSPTSGSPTGSPTVSPGGT